MASTGPVAPGHTAAPDRRALSTLRSVLTLISFFTVLFTEQIPRPLFDMIAMTYRYEWRAMSYALFLHEDYPPFDFQPAADDDGVEPHTSLSITYPERLGRWKPLYKWFLAIPHYFVLVALAIGAVFVVIGGFFAVVFTGEYPLGARDFLVDVYRYGLRVERLRRVAHRPVPAVRARRLTAYRTTALRGSRRRHFVSVGIRSRSRTRTPVCSTAVQYTRAATSSDETRAQQRRRHGQQELPPRHAAVTDQRRHRQRGGGRNVGKHLHQRRGAARTRPGERSDVPEDERHAQRQRHALHLVLAFGERTGHGVDPAVERIAEDQPHDAAATTNERRRAPGSRRRPRRGRARTRPGRPPARRATAPMPITLPASSWIGRTVASRTSTTRLAFSSMTPMSVHVRYWVSTMKMRTTPSGTRWLRPSYGPSLRMDAVDRQRPHTVRLQLPVRESGGLPRTRPPAERRGYRARTAARAVASESDSGSFNTIRCAPSTTMSSRPASSAVRACVTFDSCTRSIRSPTLVARLCSPASSVAELDTTPTR